ncbi:MAG: shikimate dehydrogenase, partial [Hyphomicrobiales bacterium]
IGWPVAHSRSPIIHNYWLKTLNLAGEYGLLPVAPEKADDYFQSFENHGLIGANVTVPYKEVAFRCVNETDEISKRLGSVNTLYVKNGKVCATSTDGYGFLQHLKHAVDGWSTKDKSIVLIGAGGAARAIAGALIDEGAAQIIVCNRTLTKAETFAKDLGAPVSAANWDHRHDILREADQLVNTTSLGMTGNSDLDLLLNKLPTSAVVYDIVYTPLETSLLKNAAKRGHRCVDGLGMLLHQAVPGFELWFGQKPEVTEELRALVIGSLTADCT